MVLTRDIRVYTLYENDERKIDPLSNAQPVPNLYTFLKTNNSLIKILALQKMYEQNNNLVPIEAEFFQLLPIKLQRAATLLAQSGPKQSTKINITLAK